MTTSPSAQSDLTWLAAELPAWAGDLAANVGRLGELPLTPRQLWGTLLAASAAAAPDLAARLAPAARAFLSASEMEEVGTAVAVMSMNNVFGRFCHITSHEILQKGRLGMSVQGIRQPSTDKADFELWLIAVSAINGCGRCIDSHVTAARASGVADEVILNVVRVAAVAYAVGVALRAIPVFGTASGEAK